MGNPGISVVVPVQGRVDLLRYLLESLVRERTIFALPMEIIVIDDSSAIESAMIRNECVRAGALYLAGTSSVRQKRNMGIRVASYDVVLFIDSDCEATPGLLQAHFEAYTSDEIGGAVGETVFIGPKTFMWGVIERTQYLNSFSFASRMEYAPWGPCCNISYKRTLLLYQGGFLERWPLKLGGDDAELGLRITGSGYKLRCQPSARVHHSRDTWNAFSKVWERAFRWGRMDYHLYYCLHRERVKVVLPRFTTIFATLVFVGIIGSIRHGAVSILWAPSWAVLALLSQGILTCLDKKESNLVSLSQEMLADLLGLAFEFGTYFESLRYSDARVFVNGVDRGPVQSRFAHREWVIQGWSYWVAILMLIAINQILF